MKYKFIQLLMAFLLINSFQLKGQFISDGSEALPEKLPVQSGLLLGYPKDYTEKELQEYFKNPPRGFGNVPFYWWNGEKLDKEKLSYQLGMLKDASTDGFAVSYIHTHPKADKEINAKGYGGFGMTDAGDPSIFTKEWHDIWNWFSGECGKYNIGLGLDDYTLTWQGNGYFPDQISQLPDFKTYQGELRFKIDTIGNKALYSCDITPTFLGCVAWSADNKTHIDLSSFAKEQKIIWEAPAGEWIVYQISLKPNYMLHPRHGQEVIDRYFDSIENQMTEEQKKGSNFFFQDELSIPFSQKTWSPDIPKRFKEKKGYDIIPYLPALQQNIGSMTFKVRLDYYDVLMDLVEECYFKPIFNWHWKRGLIYGCDNFGRGLNPKSYVDYFRTTRWFSAPGNDAPARGSSLLQCKVSSSIAHLYKRPRTWLEAFHSMGWGSDGEVLTSQFDQHAIGGGNLLCLHGLYYSTRGGWLEWAPPDFHFRMPYWEHMKYWLKYTERMCFLLSQGTHVCDVAIVYPTEIVQAIPNASPRLAFDLSMNLFNSGIDFDFLDYQSLKRAATKDGYLSVSGEKYKVLILADMEVMHHSSLQTILMHYRNGGIVMAAGKLPEATTLTGANNPEVDAIVRELFGVTATEQKSGKTPFSQTNKAGGRTVYLKNKNIAKEVTPLLVRDFKNCDNDSSKVMHRRIGMRDIYMVLNVKPGDELFFRSKGKVEIWDAFSGEVKPIKASREDENGTYLRLNTNYNRSTLVVFNNLEKTVFENGALKTGDHLESAVRIEGEWDIEYVPTMNNKFGDFRLPEENDMIGTEARTFSFINSDKAPKDWYKPDFNYRDWDDGIYGYGLQGYFCQLTPNGDFDQFVKDCLQNKAEWKPYHFSWQFGVWEHPGSQGYHGLKGKVDDGFFIMGDNGHYAFKSNLIVNSNGSYRIEYAGIKPTALYIDGKMVTDTTLYLKKGKVAMLAIYKGIKKGKLINDRAVIDERSRGAVVLFPVSIAPPQKHNAYTKKLGMSWNDSEERLLFDPYGNTKGNCSYLFDAGPGLEAMDFSIYGNNPIIWIDGEKLPPQNIRIVKTEKGMNHYKVLLDSRKEHLCRVAMQIKPFAGYNDTGIFTHPIKLICKTGKLKPCNWATIGQLLHYSGGMWYRKNLELTRSQLSNKIILDLGEVVATCEVHVNGKKAGILLNSPFKIEIQDFVKAGTNKIEVLVYSTLSNHYQTVPTPVMYRGDAKAGLIGPVKIEYWAQNK